jgi:hypothetical protein
MALLSPVSIDLWLFVLALALVFLCGWMLCAVLTAGALGDLRSSLTGYQRVCRNQAFDLQVLRDKAVAVCRAARQGRDAAIANLAEYLEARPEALPDGNMARAAGLEPATRSLEGCCSIQAELRPHQKEPTDAHSTTASGGDDLRQPVARRADGPAHPRCGTPKFKVGDVVRTASGHSLEVEAIWAFGEHWFLTGTCASMRASLSCREDSATLIGRRCPHCKTWSKPGAAPCCTGSARDELELLRARQARAAKAKEEFEAIYPAASGEQHADGGAR